MFSGLCRSAFVGFGLQFDRGPRPLVDRVALGADRASAVGDAHLEVERAGRIDVVVARQGVGHDVEKAVDPGAGAGREARRPVAGKVVRGCGELRADIGDVRRGRGESRAVARGVEAAACERRVVAPEAVVTARDFDGESSLRCHRSLVRCR